MSYLLISNFFFMANLAILKLEDKFSSLVRLPILGSIPSSRKILMLKKLVFVSSYGCYLSLIGTLVLVIPLCWQNHVFVCKNLKTPVKMWDLNFLVYTS